MKKVKLKRRKFIKKSALAAVGAIIAPSIVPSTVLGENLPSERITLGFIGTGKQGTYLMRSFLNEPMSQVVAVCDVDALKLARGKKMTEDHYAQLTRSGKYNGCAATGEFREILGRDDIDAVVIATPDHWHSVPAVWAARSRKDIYCEKPMALTVAEGRAMVKAVRKFGRVFQTGSMQRSDQSFRFACELVRNGYIGDIKLAQVDVGGPPVYCDLPAEPVPDYLDWDRWLGPSQWRPYNAVLSPHITKDVFPHWRDYKGFGGGGMTDWGAHMFDIVQWALGMDDSGPVEVIPPGDSEHKVLTYRYANGTLMKREPNGYHQGGVMFHGTKGRLYVTRWFLHTWPESLMNIQLKPDEIHLYNSTNHHADWLRAIRKRTKPICDVEIGHRSATVCNIGNLAYEMKRPVKWDPVNEKFTNSEDANRFLGRNFRSPWKL